MNTIRSMNVARHHLHSDMDMGTGLSLNMSAMDMGHSSEGSGQMSMSMYFTTRITGVPVLFKTLSAANGAQAFGIFILFFGLAFLTKGLEFTKNYLEQKVWSNPNYLVTQKTTIIEQCECDGEAPKVYNEPEETLFASQKPPRLITVLTRDVIRLSLCFIIEMFSYALMLVAMSFSLLYFFAVVIGMALGRFFFERVGDKISLRPGQNNYQTRD